MPLHPLAQEAYKEVSKHIPQDRVLDWTIALFGEIAELDAIARRSKRRKDSQDIIDSLDFPLSIGAIKLFKLSVGAMEWLANYPEQWWGPESTRPDFRMLTLATAFAMAHRQKEGYFNLISPTLAKISILTWAKETKLAEDVLIAGASFMLPQNDSVARLIMGSPEDSEDPQTDIQTIGQIVAKQAGVSVFEAIWEMPADSFWGFYCDCLDKEEDEYNGILKEAGKNISLETWVGKQKILLIKTRRNLLRKSIEWLKGQMEEGAIT